MTATPTVPDAPATRTSAPLDFGGLLRRAEGLPSRTPEDARAERSHAARRVLERLPVYLQGPGVGQRTIDPKLLSYTARWTWGDPGVGLLGGTGIGKSTAAALVYRRLLGIGWREGGEAWERAQRLRWFAADALGRARREHRLGHGDAPELLEAASASLLVLDDAGWDRDPEGVSDVLAVRYERGAPTLITSGKTLVELAHHYGAAVMRKLVESGGKRATIIDCFAPVVR